MIVLGITDPIGDDNAAAILVDGRARGDGRGGAAEPHQARAEDRASPCDRVVPRTGRLHARRRRRDRHRARRAATGLPAGVGFDHREQASPPARLADPSATRLAATGLHKYFVSELERGLRPAASPGETSRACMWVRHHLAHAASAFYLSEFEEANVISLDGPGGQDSGLLAVGRGTEIDVIRWVERETSWGCFYEEYTGRLGFRMHSDEGKVMGLAAYGDPAARSSRTSSSTALTAFRSTTSADLDAALAEIKPRRQTSTRSTATTSTSPRGCSTASSR